MVFECLADHHDRESFSCGVPELDEYFHKYARQNARKGIAAVFVLVPEAGSRTVLGFYTLSATAVDAGKLPVEFLRKLPRYQHLPATLIGRLARSLGFPGQGIGEKLLINALRRSAENSAIIGSLAAVVKAKNDEARQWYLRYGFRELKGHPRCLYLPMQSIKDHLRREAGEGIAPRAERGRRSERLND
jgi:hypothetical protein